MSETTTSLESPAKWQPATRIRRGSPRATVAEARAKLVHTSHGGRQIVVYLTKPLMDRMQWTLNGTVSPSWTDTGSTLLVRLAPAHKGIKARRDSKTSTTCRLVISGDFIAPSACAPVRRVSVSTSGSVLGLILPREWLNPDMIRATAPATVSP